MTEPPLYDVEKALREVARHRRHRDAATRATIEASDDLAVHISRHFGPEALETAGLALVLGSASISGLALTLANEAPGARGVVSLLCNILSYAGQRIVLDSRAASDEVVS